MRALILLIAALLLAACSSSGEDNGGESGGDSASGGEVDAATFAEDDRTPEEVVQDAVDATVATDSFRIDSDIEASIAFQNFGLNVTGAVDYDDLVSDVTLEVAQGGVRAEIQVLADGESLWIRPDGDQVPPVPEDNVWAQGEASRLDGGQFGPTGVAGVVLLLLGADEVEEGEVEERDGVPAREFTTTITYQEALAAAGDRAEELQSAFSLSGGAAEVDLEAVVWIGEDDVIREFGLVAAPPDDLEVELEVDIDLSLSEVNQPVETPEAPEEDVLTGTAAAGYLDQVMQ